MPCGTIPQFSTAGEHIFESLGDGAQGQALKKSVGRYNSQQLKNSFLDAVDMITGLGEFKQLIKQGFKSAAKQESKEQAAKKIAQEAGKYVFNEVAKDGDLVIYAAKVGGQVIEFGGNVIRNGDQLIIKNFDIDGNLTNQIGIRGLKEIAKSFGKQNGAKQVIIEAAKRTTGANSGKIPGRLIFNVD